MKLVYNKKSDDPFYYIQTGARIGKKVKTLTVARLGRHSDLIKKGIKDPLTYAKDELARYQKEYDDAKDNPKSTFSITVNSKTLPVSNELVPKSNLLNIGYIYLQNIYNNLKLKDFFTNISKNKNYTFNANDINRFLVFDRILDPKSKLQTVKYLGNYFEQPIFSHQQALRFMDVLVNNYDSYLSHLYDNSANIVKRDTTVCYYDCTNYYFEIEQYDKDFIDELTGETVSGMRRYGPSKEHRPNPIVQMGLFMDKQGIPLTMGIFSGNTNEQKTAVSVEQKLIKSLKNKKIIYCADAGLGSASIRLFNDLGGRAFIVTQSIKKLSQELQNEIFDDKNYKLLSNNSLKSIKEMKEFDIQNENNLTLYKDKIYKVIETDSLVDLGLYEEKVTKNGKVRNIKSKGKLKQRIIVTFSRKMYEYQRSIRNSQIERAKAILETNSVEKRKKGPNDVMRFIKSTSNTNYEIDIERIAEEEKYDGFYALATNLMDEDVKEIININSNRYKIEDCFRILKTNFDARPVYHRLENRIVAHFMVCYTALLIYRLLENKLLEHGYHFTINDILSTLKRLNVSLKGINYEALYDNSIILNALNDTFNINIGYDCFSYKNLNKIFKKI